MIHQLLPEFDLLVHEKKNDLEFSIKSTGGPYQARFTLSCFHSMVLQSQGMVMFTEPQVFENGNLFVRLSVSRMDFKHLTMDLSPSFSQIIKAEDLDVSISPTIQKFNMSHCYHTFISHWNIHQPLLPHRWVPFEWQMCTTKSISLFYFTWEDMGRNSFETNAYLKCCSKKKIKKHIVVVWK